MDGQFPEIPATEIPQADALPRVLHLVRHINEHGDRKNVIGFDDIRDVKYYSQAARILGLLDTKLQVTDAGREVLSLAEGQQCRRLGEFFAGSVCGAAWLAWQGVTALSSLDPEKANTFIAQCCPIKQSTARRRATTLRQWLRAFLTGRMEGPSTTSRAKSAKKGDGQLTLARWKGERTSPATPHVDWPDPSRFPHNEAHQRVSAVVDKDLDASDSILLVVGYASIARVVTFLARRAERPANGSLRLLFGNEPFSSPRVQSFRAATRAKYEQAYARSQKLADEVRDYWLERGVSIVLSSAMLKTREFVSQGAAEIRLGSQRRPLHAKIFLGEKAVTIGSSNFTHAGFGGQSEANVRFETDEQARFEGARQLAEGFWVSGVDFRDEFLALLDALLKAVTWQEALARACAAILEGEWAKAYIPPEDLEALDPPLWPHQRQGLSQAIWVLENVGSVLVADATGSGKTRMGSWLIRAAYDRQVRSGHPRRASPLVVVPPPLIGQWEDDLASTGEPFQVHSHGSLSNPNAAKHKKLVDWINGTELLAVDEAHNFLNQSSYRTGHLSTNYADQVILFTATPINRGPTDITAMIELLGADNLPDDALEIFARLSRLMRGGLHQPSRKDLNPIRQEIERFMVRRTRSDLNRIAEERKEEYRLSTGRYARYPHHHARYYDCMATKRDIEIADQISVLAGKLTGVARLGRRLVLPRALASRGMTEEQYLRRYMSAIRALSIHIIFDCLRSSRQALFEHIHGTDAAVKHYSLNREVRKAPTGNVLSTLEKNKGRVPDNKLKGIVKSQFPGWLWDPEQHSVACDADAALYRSIAELVDELSDARENAKVNLLRGLLDRVGLVVGFDSHLISLVVFEQKLRNQQVHAQLFTGQTGASSKRRAQELLGLDTTEEKLVALCSDALSEGMNLQGASCVVHLDTPTVIRTAEQRAGRVDRMNTRHDEIEIWWPRDPPSFAPRRRDLLKERHAMVSDLIGANLLLPDDVDPLDEKSDERVDVQDLAVKANIEKRAEALDAYEDAFQPVRKLIGSGGLISKELYAAIRSSQADVISCVSLVSSDTSWAFMAVGGLNRSAPRWVYLGSPKDEPISELGQVAEWLRKRLSSDPPSVVLDQRASEIMQRYVNRLEEVENQLLPVRRRRALDLAKRVLDKYVEDAWERGDHERLELVSTLLGVVRPDVRAPHPDPRAVADAWIRLIRPQQREALRHRSRHRRPWTLRELEAPLCNKPIPTEELRRAFTDLPLLAPASERIVAMILGVPEHEAETTTSAVL